MDSVKVKKERLEFISILRVFSMICILLCHFVQEVPISIIQSTSQFFNIGVQLFFILSGFCFGLQGKAITSPKIWYKKRLKRVFVPYEIFLLMYFILFLMLRKRIFWRDWGMYVLGIQGEHFRIPGIEQLWFITPLLVCYIITPLISISVSKFNNSQKLLKTSILIAVIFNIAISFIPNNNFYVIVSPIPFYFIAYICGTNYKPFRPSKKYVLFALFISVAAFVTRYFLRTVLDGSLLYERAMCSITYYIIAFGIFVVFKYLFFNATENKFIHKIDSISFEVYLTHYAFLRGAYPFFKLTAYTSINLTAAFIATVILSIIVHLISTFFQKKIFK